MLGLVLIFILVCFLVPITNSWEIHSTKNFAIHFLRKSSDSVNPEDKDENNIPDYVDSIGVYFELAWRIGVDSLGFPAPASIPYFNRKPLEAPTGKYNVFVVNVEDYGNLSGATGKTFDYGTADKQLFGTITYIDNDLVINKGQDTIRNYRRKNGPIPYTKENSMYSTLKHFVAHEFFHAIQTEIEKGFKIPAGKKGGSFNENSPEWFSVFVTNRFGGHSFSTFLKGLEGGLLNIEKNQDYTNYRYLKFMEMVHGLNSIKLSINSRLKNPLEASYKIEEDIEGFRNSLVESKINPEHFIKNYSVEIAKIYSGSGSLFKDEEIYNKIENLKWPLTSIKGGEMEHTKAIKPLAIAIHKIFKKDFQKFAGFEIKNTSDEISPVFHTLFRYPSKALFTLNPNGEKKTGFEFKNSEYAVVFSINAWANATVNFTPKVNIGISRGKPNFGIYENWVKLNHVSEKRYQLTIEFKNSIAEHISIELADIFGRPLAKKIEGAAGSRIINHVFSLNSEFAGVVFVNFKIGNSKFVKRIAVTGL